MSTGPCQFVCLGLITLQFNEHWAMSVCVFGLNNSPIQWALGAQYQTSEISLHELSMNLGWSLGSSGETKCRENRMPTPTTCGPMLWSISLSIKEILKYIWTTTSPSCLPIVVLSDLSLIVRMFICTSALGKSQVITISDNTTQSWMLT